MLNWKKKNTDDYVLNIFEPTNKCDAAFKVLSGVPEVQGVGEW